MSLWVTLALVLTMSHLMSVFAEPKSASHSCLEVPGVPDSVKIDFTITGNTDPIFKVYAFDATTLDTSTSTNRIETAECIKDYIASNIYNYEITVNVTDDTHACGARVYEEDGVTYIDMLFRVYAYSITVLDVDDESFVLRCRMDDLNGAAMSTAMIELTPEGIVTVVQPQVGVYLRILASVDNKPLHITTLGQDAILSIECLTEQASGPDNFGTHFFIGFLSNNPISGDSSSQLYVVIQPRYSLQTDITITTALEGIVQDQISIDDGTSIKVAFSSKFMGCSEDGVSEVADIGIEINSDHMEIGVLVCNLETETADCYTALSVDVTGTEYWGASMMAANQAAEFMIIAHEDDTSIEIDVPATSSHTSAGETVSFMLNKLEAYHFAVTKPDADKSHVNGYHIAADKTVSVISGNENYADDHLAVQVPPAETCGKHYVLVPVDFSNDGRLTKYIIQALTTDVTTTVTQHLADSTTQDYNITTTTYPPTVIEIASGQPCEIVANNAIMVTQIIEPPPGGGLGLGPSILIMPSVDQWAPSYTFNFDTDGYLSTAATVFKSSDDINQFKVNTHNVSTPPTDVVAGPNGYVFGQGLSFPANTGYTFSLDDGITTMMVLSYVSAGTSIAGSDVGIAMIPWGMRYAPFDVCVKVGRRGDGVDNDCDGLTDEEIMNNLDDDGDELIDEDPKAPDSAIGGAIAVRPINCRASGDPSFPVASTVNITDADGCAVQGAGSFKAASEMVPIGSSSDQLKILHSGPFRLGMFIGAPRVYFMCDIENYCTDSSDAACTTICASSRARKKREVGDGYPTNISTDIWVFPYIADKDKTYTNETNRDAALGDCMDNAYIQLMISFLTALALMSLFTAVCFCCLLRRKNNREKDPRRLRYLDMFRKKSF